MTHLSLKQKLLRGDVTVGTEISRFRSAEVANVYARAGLDWVFIDTEHTAFNRETVADMIRTARNAGIAPVVRVPQGEYAFVAGYLDLGAQGIIVPRVNTPEEVRNIVSWTRYPPHGIRGFACTPNQTDDHDMDPEAFIERNHAETLLAIQFERQEAIDNIEEMLSIDGVDVACLGYMDLSVDKGLVGQLEHPEMITAVERMIDVANEKGVAPGMIHPDEPVLGKWIERGMRFVSCATDAIHLERATRACAANLRQFKPAQPVQSRD